MIGIIGAMDEEVEQIVAVMYVHRFLLTILALIMLSIQVLPVL